MILLRWRCAPAFALFASDIFSRVFPGPMFRSLSLKTIFPCLSLFLFMISNRSISVAMGVAAISCLTDSASNLAGSAMLMSVRSPRRISYGVRPTLVMPSAFCICFKRSPEADIRLLQTLSSHMSRNCSGFTPSMLRLAHPENSSNDGRSSAPLKSLDSSCAALPSSSLAVRRGIGLNASVLGRSDFSGAENDAGLDLLCNSGGSSSPRALACISRMRRLASATS